MTYGPAFLGGLVWAWAKYPGEMSPLTGVYAKSFGLLAAVYDQLTEVEGYGVALEAALDEIRTKPGDALDVATGTGFVARRLKRAFPQSRVTGVDIASEMIGVAQHLAVADGLDIDFEAGDSQSLPFEDASFDLVIMQNSVPFPEEMMRVLRPKGRAVAVYSVGGPWVAMAWPELASRFEKAGAEHTWGSRADPGFFGVARRAG
jgi:SAM-dependent methyltransferase